MQNESKCNVHFSTIIYSFIVTYLLNKTQTEVARAVGKEKIHLKAFSESSKLVMLTLIKSY